MKPIDSETKVLLILAGFSGAGKSTLLRLGLQKGLKLFGSELNSRWLSTNPPATGPEWIQTPEKIRVSGSWFSGRHTSFLEKLPELPNVVVMHLDLLSVITKKHHYHARYRKRLDTIFPRELESICNEETNRFLIDFFLQQPLFRRFDRVASNTILVPWDILVKRWFEKASKNNGLGSYRESIFKDDKVGQALMNSTVRFWLEAQKNLNPEPVLITRNYGRRIEIKRYKPSDSSEYLRRSPFSATPL